jgi:serine/threonine protein kinase
MKLCPICQRCYEDVETLCPHDQTALVTSRPGPRLVTEKYRLDRLLGRGGMGAVYAGTHVDLDRPIAVKLLLPDFTADQDALERFRREARAAARLNHPNVADTYDYGLLPEGGAYIVMELIEGQTLRQYMNAAEQLLFDEALQIIGQVAHGVEAAHRQGIIHRDLKPSNILLAHDHHNRLLAKVVDFSVAKLKEGTTSGGAALTATGSLIGTPRYMSPEQCSGHGTDTRSDIYSLGVILYEMLAKRTPFEAPTATAIAIKHIQQQPPPVSEFRADVPEALQQLITQSLSKNPAARPQTALEFAEKIEEVFKTLPVYEAVKTDVGAISHTTSRVNQTPPHSHTNPQKTDHGAETGRAGAPTEEHPYIPLENLSSHEHKQGDDPSVQAYVVSATEAEVETKVAATATSTEETNSDQKTSNATTVTSPPQSQSVRDASNTRRNRRRRATFINYAAFAAAIVAIALGVGALWMVLRNRSSNPVGANASTTLSQNRNTSSPTASTTQNSNQTLSDADAANRSPSSNANQQAGEVRSQLHKLRDEWIAATVSGDLNKQVSFYAPTVEVFYLKRNVSRSFVGAEKKRLMSRMTSMEMRAYEPETTLSDDSQTATMRFRKIWDFKGAAPSSGEVLQELSWRKTSDGWKIIVERDIQVIR